MKRISLIDWFTWCGLALFAAIAAIIAFCTPQEWTVVKLLVLVITTVVFIGTCGLVLLIKMTKRPSYETSQGVLVWAVKDSRPSGWDPEPNYITEAIEFFVHQMTEKTSLTMKDLAVMLEGARIEFRRGKVGAIGIGWLVKDKAGLQQGKAILLSWDGAVETSALFHELLHMVDECTWSKDYEVAKPATSSSPRTMGWEPDYEHKKGFWKLEPVIMGEWVHRTFGKEVK